MKKHVLWLLLILGLLLLLAGCGAQSSDAPPPKQETTITEPPPAPEQTPEAPAQEEPMEEAPEAPAQEEPAEEILEAPAQEEPAEEAPEAPAEDPIPEAAVLTGSLPVLMYHHVVPDGTECNSMTVTVGKLEKDFQWLREHGYTPVLPRELLDGSVFPEKPVLITFDDGYRSNYDLLFPLLQQYEMKAVISIMVYMQEIGVTSFLSWDMCREMAASGLVEIGSHTYRLHNLDERGGNFTPGDINGIQRRPEESDEDFRARVLDDIQRSHDLLEEKLGTDVTFFAYPFGLRESDAEALVEDLFPVTAVTLAGTADLTQGTKNLPRWTITMSTPLSSVLED